MRVVSVNVGQPAEYEWLGSIVRTAIFKEPVSGRVQARGFNLAGDEQANREVHGGADKAVYAYAAEDAAWWDRQLGPGAFGENLTLAGVPVTDALVGERWRIGSALLEVRQPRVPCAKLGLRMGDRHFPRHFAAAGRPGAYLAILQEGELGAGDPVVVEHRPGHGVTVGLVARAYHSDRTLAPRLLAAPELPAEWHEWAGQRLP
jgi:MOSC domain-containing protein YiiM